MIEIKQLDHIVLRAVDADRLIDFYCTVLGCKLERVLPELGLSQLRAGNALIDIVTLDGELGKAGGRAPGKEGRNLDHFCLTIGKVEPAALLAYLDKHQVRHGGFEERYGAEGFGDSVYIDDPQGNVVELKFEAIHPITTS